jgi:hypothetical protein
VILKLLPCAGSDNRRHPFGLDPGDSHLAGLRADLLGSAALAAIAIRQAGKLESPP